MHAERTVFHRPLLVLLVNWSHLGLHFYVRHFLSSSSTSFTPPPPFPCYYVSSAREIKWPPHAQPSPSLSSRPVLRHHRVAEYREMHRKRAFVLRLIRITLPGRREGEYKMWLQVGGKIRRNQTPFRPYVLCFGVIGNSGCFRAVKAILREEKGCSESEHHPSLLFSSRKNLGSKGRCLSFSTKFPTVITSFRSRGCFFPLFSSFLVSSWRTGTSFRLVKVRSCNTSLFTI